MISKVAIGAKTNNTSKNGRINFGSHHINIDSLIKNLNEANKSTSVTKLDKKVFKDSIGKLSDLGKKIFGK